MTLDKRPSLRKCIDEHCKTCIYDPKAAGTWRQQVTLCSVTLCALYRVRPITKSPIPDTVLDYYGLSESERRKYQASRPQEGRIGGHIRPKKYPTKGRPQFVLSKPLKTRAQS